MRNRWELSCVSVGMELEQLNSVGLMAIFKSDLDELEIAPNYPGYGTQSLGWTRWNASRIVHRNSTMKRATIC